MAILFSFIALLNFILQYYFTKKDGSFKLFKNHWTAFYGDLLFIPFNYFAIKSFDLSIVNLLIVMAVTLLVSVAINRRWAKRASGNQQEGHFFNENSNGLSRAGVVHLLFMSIESSIVINFFLSDSVSKDYSIVSCGLLGLLVVVMIGNQIRLHGRLTYDSIFNVLLIAAIVVKSAQL